MTLLSVGIGILLATIAFGVLRQSLIARRLRNWRDCIACAFFGTAAAIGSILTFAELFGLLA
jgi:hypothetical protein